MNWVWVVLFVLLLIGAFTFPIWGPPLGVSLPNFTTNAGP